VVVLEFSNHEGALPENLLDDSGGQVWSAQPDDLGGAPNRAESSEKS
jgi:hypothetical protein